MDTRSATVSMLVLALALGLAPAGAAAETAPAGGAAAPRPATAKPGAKKKAPRKRRRPSGSGSASNADERAAAVQNAKNKPITAFPAEQAATVSRIFDEHRREQVADAERAARAAKQDDRWNSVLFAIRELDSGAGYDVCFWRALAYYRQGELARARKTRQLCVLAPSDVGTLDHEDAAASSLQPPSALPELRLAGALDEDGQARAGTTKPVANPEAYTGPSPAPPK